MTMKTHLLTLIEIHQFTTVFGLIVNNFLKAPSLFFNLKFFKFGFNHIKSKHSSVISVWSLINPKLLRILIIFGELIAVVFFPKYSSILYLLSNAAYGIF